MQMVSRSRTRRNQPHHKLEEIVGVSRVAPQSQLARPAAIVRVEPEVQPLAVSCRFAGKTHHPKRRRQVFDSPELVRGVDHRHKRRHREKDCRERLEKPENHRIGARALAPPEVRIASIFRPAEYAIVEQHHRQACAPRSEHRRHGDAPAGHPVNHPGRTSVSIDNTSLS